MDQFRWLRFGVIGFVLLCAVFIGFAQKARNDDHAKLVQISLARSRFAKSHLVEAECFIRTLKPSKEGEFELPPELKEMSSNGKILFLGLSTVGNCFRIFCFDDNLDYGEGYEYLPNPTVENCQVYVDTWSASKKIDEHWYWFQTGFER